MVVEPGWKGMVWDLGRPKATHKEEEVEDEEEILDEAETVVLGRHLLLAR